MMIYDEDDLNELNMNTVETDEFIEKVQSVNGYSKEEIIDKLDLLHMHKNMIVDWMDSLDGNAYELRKNLYMRLVKLEDTINQFEVQKFMLNRKEEISKEE